MPIDYDKYKGHTPGEWAIDPKHGDNFISDTDGEIIAMAMTRKERTINATLIADAPLLLARCQELEEELAAEKTRNEMQSLYIEMIGEQNVKMLEDIKNRCIICSQKYLKANWPIPCNICGSKKLIAEIEEPK